MTDTVKQLKGTERLIRLDCLFDGNPGCACSHCEASDTIARLAAERDRLKVELNDNSTLAHWAGWKVRALKAEAQRDRLKEALQKQHDWHLNAGVVGLPDGNGGWVEIDNAAEYSDGPLCSQTVEALGGTEAQCEWRQIGFTREFRMQCDDSPKPKHLVTENAKFCPSCGKPINIVRTV